MSVCHICSKPSTKHCSDCQRVHYCSKECQTKDWKRHKIECKDTNLVLACDKHVEKLLSHMSVPKENCIILMVDRDIQGTQCMPYTNVLDVIKVKGGTLVSGWLVYENEYIVEAEAWCAWKPPNSNYTLNVTPSEDGKAFGTLFFVDPSVSEFINNNGSFPLNKILMK